MEDKYLEYVKKAFNEDVIFSLSEREFINMSNKPCSYCGKEGGEIDRIDNSKGYTLDNCVSCCQKCKTMKGELTVHEFISQCREISNVQNFKLYVQCDC